MKCISFTNCKPQVEASNSVWKSRKKTSKMSLDSLLSTKPPLPFPTAPMLPILSVHVERALAITFIVLYGLLFLFIYVQLFLILYYGHKRFSYQTVFLYLCLFWSALRTTLFSFYILNAPEVSMLSFFPYWLLLGFPVCLQFTSLCLLILYFAQVSSKFLLFPFKYRAITILIFRDFKALVNDRYERLPNFNPALHFYHIYNQ